MFSRSKIIYWTDKISMFIAWHLPNKIIMWVFVRVMARAWEKLNVHPDELTYSSVWKVWKKEFEPDRT